MLDQLTARPFLFSVLRLDTQLTGSAAPLTADLRLRASSAGGDPAAGEILSVRIVQSLGWNPDQPLYFEAVRGDFTLTGLSSGEVRLTGEIPGFYRRPVTDFQQFVARSADFFVPQAFPATLDMSLVLSLPATGPAVPQVSGSLGIRSEAFAADYDGMQRIDAAVIPGPGYLFPHDLPALDLTGTACEYYLKILPVFVQRKAGTTFRSLPWLGNGAVEVWMNCGIKIIQQAPISLIVEPEVIDKLANGNTEPLWKAICCGGVPRDRGVPVAFVHPLFMTGGGWTSGHGAETAIVAVTDRCPEDTNKTLLAHELGHVLGGEEAGGPTTVADYDYWIGQLDTIMEGTGDYQCGPTDRVTRYTCRNARRFALWGPNV